MAINSAKTVLEILVLVCFVIGMTLMFTATASLALMAWSLPAGWAAGGVLGDMITKDNK